MKKKGAVDAGGKELHQPALKTKLLTSPPSMTEIRAPMLPTLKKASRKDLEIDAYTNPFKTNIIAEEDESPMDHEPYFNRGDDSPKLMRKKKKKRVRHVDLIDEEDNIEE
jgi:hypothetical protein